MDTVEELDGYMDEIGDVAEVIATVDDSLARTEPLTPETIDTQAVAADGGTWLPSRYSQRMGVAPHRRFTRWVVGIAWLYDPC